jgi:hypothetical protein
MESLFSFLVGLFHPLQHAGLSRRTPTNPTNARYGKVTLRESGVDARVGYASGSKLAIRAMTNLPCGTERVAPPKTESTRPEQDLKASLQGHVGPWVIELLPVPWSQQIPAEPWVGT